MRCLFTLLVLMILATCSSSAQNRYQPPVDTNSLGFQIPDRTDEDFRAHKPFIMFRTNYTAGIPTSFLRLFYDPSNPYIKDSLLIDYVTTNPSQNSQIYKQLHHLDDPSDPMSTWHPVGWLRADLDTEGRMIRLWGQDAYGRYWIWRGSLPFTVTTVPDASAPKAVVE